MPTCWNQKQSMMVHQSIQLSLIIPKSDTATVKKIENAINAAYVQGESKLRGNGKSVPKLELLKTPLRDGDLERYDDETYL